MYNNIPFLALILAFSQGEKELLVFVEPIAAYIEAP